MGTNDGWPEAFGFSLVGGSPVMINEVEEGGSAQQAGLQVGDFVVELNGENVEEWSKDEVNEQYASYNEIKDYTLTGFFLVVLRMATVLFPL